MGRLRYPLLLGTLVLSLAYVFWHARAVPGAGIDPLTPGERSFLAARGPIRYAPDPSFPPFEFVDGAGRVAGITPELLTLLGKKLGVEFRMVRYPRWSDVLAAVKRDEVDLLGTLTRTPEREAFLLYSKPYLSVPYVLFVREDSRGIHSLADVSSRRLGVVKDYGINAWLSSRHPELRPVAVESAAAGLSQVSTGQLDAFLETLPVGLYLVREHSLSNIRMARAQIYATPQHLAVRRGDDTLLAILQKGLDSLTPAERTAVFVRWTGQDFSRLTAEVPRWFGQALVGLVVVAALSLAWVAALRRGIHRQTGALLESEGKYRDLYRRAAEQEELYKSLLRSIPDPVALYALNGEARYVNPSFTDTFGFTLEDVRGRRIPFVPEEEIDRTGAEIRRVVSGQACTGFETRRLTRDGRTVDVSLSSSMYTDPEGKPAGIVVILRDITERKRAEEERAALEDQLRQAQKMEAIGTLAGGIAHDFNNILAAIVGYADLTLTRVPESSLERSHVEQILKAGFRARDLVQQILTLSRKSPQERRLVEWSPLVREALKLLRAAIPSTIEIRAQVDPEAGPVMADPTQLHQVLMNLCTNARYAMKETGGVLSVDLERRELPERGDPAGLPAGSYVRLSVRDTGPGMDAATQRRIFEPYFTTKPVGEGSGLGLAVVHGIVAALGGAIRVQSEPGQGSTFEVYLPRAESGAPFEPASTDPVVGGPERILFVDDEPSVADASQRILEALGYSVVTATSSRAGLEAFQTSPYAFDLVITDQTLPQMTGEELTRQVLRLRPDLPVLLCTGYSDVLTEEKARAVGARELLMKPYDTRALAQAVRRALTGRVSPEAVPGALSRNA